MICSVEAFARAAESCAGTPFHHQGRSSGVGLDCIGLVVVALRACGIEVRDRFDYARRPDGISLQMGLLNHDFTEVQDVQRGDVLLFRYGNQPQHVALALGDGRMIHAFAPARRVVICAIGDYWRRRLVGIYRKEFKEST